jgi:hypothetical protein
MVLTLLIQEHRHRTGSGELYGFADGVTCGGRARRGDANSESCRPVRETLNYRQLHYRDVTTSSRHIATYARHK